MSDTAQQSVYAIDSCSLTALRRIYPERAFPQVWQLVETLASSGRIISVEDVLIELEAFDDVIKQWVIAHESIFLPLTADVQTAARAILAAYPTLVDVKKRKSSADPFLIAVAQVRSAVLVTEEKISGGPGRVKIPDVCRGLGMSCIPLLQMLLDEGLGA